MGISKQVSTSSGTSTYRNSRLEYHLKANDGDLHSQTMLVNGNILCITPDGEIPSSLAVTVPAKRSILIAPLSIAFINLSYVQFPACS
jgi:heparanase 1